MVKIIFLVPATINCFEIKCDFSVDESWTHLPNLYTCLTISDAPNMTLSDRSVTSIIGSHVGNRTNNDVEGFYINRRMMNYFPQHLDRYFTNLRAIAFHRTGLKEIHKEDLRPFGEKLESIRVSSCEIEIIERDLFKFNPKLIGIGMHRNKIKFIDGNSLRQLKSLRYLWLEDNDCIDKSANDKQGVQKVINDVWNKCYMNYMIFMNYKYLMRDRREMLEEIEMMKMRLKEKIHGDHINVGLKNSHDDNIDEIENLLKNENISGNLFKNKTRENVLDKNQENNKIIFNSISETIDNHFDQNQKNQKVYPKLNENHQKILENHKKKPESKTKKTQISEKTNHLNAKDSKTNMKSKSEQNKNVDDGKNEKLSFRSEIGSNSQQENDRESIDHSQENEKSFKNLKYDQNFEISTSSNDLIKESKINEQTQENISQDLNHEFFQKKKLEEKTKYVENGDKSIKNIFQNVKEYVSIKNSTHNILNKSHEASTVDQKSLNNINHSDFDENDDAKSKKLKKDEKIEIETTTVSDLDDGAERNPGMSKNKSGNSQTNKIKKFKLGEVSQSSEKSKYKKIKFDQRNSDESHEDHTQSFSVVDVNENDLKKQENLSNNMIKSNKTILNNQKNFKNESYPEKVEKTSTNEFSEHITEFFVTNKNISNENENLQKKSSEKSLQENENTERENLIIKSPIDMVKKPGKFVTSPFNDESEEKISSVTIMIESNKNHAMKSEVADQVVNLAHNNVESSLVEKLPAHVNLDNEISEMSSVIENIKSRVKNMMSFFRAKNSSENLNSENHDNLKHSINTEVTKIDAKNFQETDNAERKSENEIDKATTVQIYSDITPFETSKEEK